VNRIKKTVRPVSIEKTSLIYNQKELIFSIEKQIIYIFDLIEVVWKTNFISIAYIMSVSKRKAQTS